MSLAAAVVASTPFRRARRSRRLPVAVVPLALLACSGGVDSASRSEGTGTWPGSSGGPTSSPPHSGATGGAEAARAPGLDGGSGTNGSAQGGAGTPDISVTGGRPVATWYSALDQANATIFGFTLPSPMPLAFSTVRQVARASIGGRHIRLKFSNRYGSSPLTFGKVRVASSLGQGAIEPSTDTSVTFQGASSVTIAPGMDTWSDSVAFSVAERDDIAVSVFVPGPADLATEHRYAQRSNFVNFGDSTTSADVTRSGNKITSGHWLTEIDVTDSVPANVLVVFGDSITDGVGSTLDLNRRFPDQLARLASASAPSGLKLAVVNAGIGGNRWLHEGLGEAASARFATDAIGVTGASHVLILLGINDIGFSALSSAEAVSAAEIIGALTAATRAARAADLKILVGTLLPFGGSFYYSHEGEEKRRAVNHWIRNNDIADGVIDFDALLRDASDPTKLDRRYDSGDHLHPNDEGYEAMAKGVDLNTLRDP